MKSMISVKHKGSFQKTEKFFSKALKENWESILNRYGQEGVEILKAATPSQSGETANSWTYEIEKRKGSVTIVYHNTHENKGVNVVKLIVFGHGLWNGGYVAGNDFVSPAISEMLNRLANDAWREVTR